MDQAFGKYTLQKRLGGGGMAEVFRARLHGPEGFSKDIALKLILPHFSSEPEFVGMFIREATLAAKLDHANIVRIHEFDQVEGRYYIAMELVDGKDLRKLMARSREIERSLRVPEAVSIALEACKGLAFAHGELTLDSPEVVHRDISPHNIIVSKAGEVKITDFGIAKLASSTGVTKTGVIKGKARYMSPEQARGDPVDRRSDLFSLGCVLWELLTGQRLFSGDNDMAIMKNLEQGPINPPSKYNRDVPAELDSVLLKLLNRDPNQRYASAASLASGLEKILSSCEGISRSTLLSDLYQDLFTAVREGTGRLPAPEAQEEPEDLDIVEPVGPDTKTRTAEFQSAPSPQPQIPKTRRRLMVAFMAVAVITGVVGIVLLKQLGEPEKMSEPALKPAPLESPQAPEKFEVVPAPVLKPAEGEGEPEIEPAPAPKKKPIGRLYLNAIPWAKVYRGKKLLGDTPLENIKLPVGKYRFRLVNEELKVNKTISVVIKKNQTTRKTFNLREK